MDFSIKTTLKIGIIFRPNTFVLYRQLLESVKCIESFLHNSIRNKLCGVSQEFEMTGINFAVNLPHHNFHLRIVLFDWEIGFLLHTCCSSLLFSIFLWNYKYFYCSWKIQTNCRENTNSILQSICLCFESTASLTARYNSHLFYIFQPHPCQNWPNIWITPYKIQPQLL